MITLPMAPGMASANDPMTQPSAGARAPPDERIPQPASRQVARIAAQQPIAAAGTDPAIQPYWKEPITASMRPSRNRTPYAPPVVNASPCRTGSRPAGVPGASRCRCGRPGVSPMALKATRGAPPRRRALSLPRRGHEAAFPGPGGDLHPVPRPGLGLDVRQVRLGSAERDEELARDLGVGASACVRPDDLRPPFGQGRGRAAWRGARGAVPAGAVQACQEVTRPELRQRGVFRDDRSTWTAPVIRIACPEGGPFVKAGTARPMREACGQLIGAGPWRQRAGVGGTIPIRFPSEDDPGDAGWHIEASYEAEGQRRVNVRSRARGLPVHAGHRLAAWQRAVAS